MYIYKFTHKDTGRVYIGQTIQEANRRRLEHLSNSRYTGTTHKFHNALRKYGEDSFLFEVIATATSLDELNTLEEQFIKEYDSINSGFNIRNGGNNKTHNPESIEKMRKAQQAAHARRRAKGTDTWVRRDGGPMLGKAHPAKGTKRIHKNNISDESRAIMSKKAKIREEIKRNKKLIKDNT